MEPSRNSRCLCGSGKRYKECHGRLDGPPGPAPVAGTIPEVVLDALNRRVQAEAQHQKNFGNVRAPISAVFKGYRLAAVGRKLLWSRDWKVFPDFLDQYLHGLLGKEWGEGQVALPFNEQHPIVQWRTIWMTAQQNQKRNPEGFFTANSGAAVAWFRLAYDLYLLEHNAQLQKRLVKRLRAVEHFQGARFEAAVAAIMLAAGYDLQFANEKLPGKHPEFVGISKEGFRQLAVEAKSRHRHGILGFPGPRAESIDSFDVAGLLQAAVEKNTADPLLIFIELNSPVLLDACAPESTHAALNEHWEKVQSMDWPAGFPAVGVVFYNDPNPWYLERAPGTEPLATVALALWPKASRHDFDARPLLSRVLQAVGQRLSIPKDFPERH